jgi:DNA-binding transcriptional regulator YiaG
MVSSTVKGDEYSELQPHIMQTDEKSLPITLFSTRKMIWEVRMRTRLSWDELAYVLNTDRGTIDSWASGGKISPCDKEHLQSILDLICKIDRGWTPTNYALLTQENDNLPLKLLSEKKYEQFLMLLGRGSGREPTPKFSEAPEVRAACPYCPSLPWYELLMPLPDPVIVRDEPLLFAKSINVPWRDPFTSK